MNERDQLIRTAIFDEIGTERKRQQKVWGNEFDDKNTPNDWLAFITRYAARAAHLATVKSTETNEAYCSDLLKAATVCVAALEAFDRAQGTEKRKAGQQRANRKRHQLYPEKTKARNAVRDAIRMGKLIRPVICESCPKKGKSEAHHWSYKEEHWLDVNWLCTDCHKTLHQSYEEG